jgi:hypothetical protein
MQLAGHPEIVALRAMFTDPSVSQGEPVHLALREPAAGRRKRGDRAVELPGCEVTGVSSAHDRPHGHLIAVDSDGLDLISQVAEGSAQPERCGVRPFRAGNPGGGSPTASWLIASSV